MVEQDSQSADFNKSYEAYNVDSIYGSDIFSLANKVSDYNYQYKAEDGYKEIILEITFKNDYGSIFRKNTKYTASDLTDKYTNLANEIKTKGSQKLITSANVTKTVQEWSKVSSATLKASFGTDSNEYKKIVEYKELNITQNDIVRASFKNKGFEYDTNGRIKKMIFEES